MKPVALISLTVVIVAFIGICCFYAGKASVSIALPEVERDTAIVRDTLRDTVRLVSTRHSTRTDTVYVAIPGDTVQVPVALPFEERRYATENYDLSIEGYKPQLLSIKVYPRTKYITETVRTPYPVTDKTRWGIGIQAGYGYNFGTGRMSPYVGVGISYDLIKW